MGIVVLVVVGVIGALFVYRTKRGYVPGAVAASQSQSHAGLPPSRLPVGHRVASALGWAAIFWVADLIVTPTFAHWAEVADLWVKHRADHPPIDNLFLFLLTIPIALVGSAAVLAFRVIVGGLVLAQRYYLTPVFGFVFGLRPDVPSSVFVAIGRLLAGGARDTGISAVEVFTGKRLSHRLFALAVVLVAIGAAIFLYRLTERVIPRSDPPIQQLERFRPTTEWRQLQHDGSNPFDVEVATVDVEHDRLAITLRFRNTAWDELPIIVSNHTSLQRVRERGQSSRWFFVSGDDQRIPVGRPALVPANGLFDGTLYFHLPVDPLEPWIFNLEFTAGGKPVSGTMYFNLTRNLP